jgi:hypothetical protein
MQSSGQISIGQAMAECQIGQQQWDANSPQLTRLAGVSQNQQYAWSYWYGKSFGTPVLENWTQYYTVNYTGANNANFGRSLFLYNAGFRYNTTGAFGQTGGDNTVTGNYPGGLTNGFNISGFYRFNNNLTVMAVNNSLDGVLFQTSIGDNVRLTNDISYSLAFGPNLWTFYGATTGVGMGAPRNYTVNLVGPAVRAQPPNGYVNGQPPPTTGGSTSHGGDDSCFVEGSLVLMADRSWKPIQTLSPGDMVMGPTGPVMVKRLHIARVGKGRNLLRFKEDPRHMWSAEHPYWVRQNGKQWWWSGDPAQMRREMEIGLLGGLKDPYSFLGGEAEFATLKGFVKRTVEVVPNHDPNTLVFIPVVEGSPVFINGYMVSAFINEFNYDYTKLDWEQHVPEFTVDQEMLDLNLKWLRDYHGEKQEV